MVVAAGTQFVRLAQFCDRCDLRLELAITRPAKSRDDEPELKLRVRGGRKQLAETAWTPDTSEDAALTLLERLGQDA